jgi:hypothetical protein
VDLFLAISQGIGLALAAGIRPFLPPLLAGAFARADAGVDFSGSDFAFLESIPFLATVLLLTIVAVAIERRGHIFTPVAGSLAIALGAVEFAGSLAGEGYAGGPGLVAGAVAALIGFLASVTFLSRAQARLAPRSQAAPRSYLTLYADAAALVLAALAVLAPPVSYLPLAFCVWLLVGQRRRASRKYEGLRVLR